MSSSRIAVLKAVLFGDFRKDETWKMPNTTYSVFDLEVSHNVPKASVNLYRKWCNCNSD